MISAMYAASFSAKPAIAAVSGVIRSLVFQLMYSGPNGTPSTTRGNNVDMLYQNSSCTSSGVPKEPDVQARQLPQQQAVRQTGNGQHQTNEHTEQHGNDGQAQRHAQTFDHRTFQEPLRDNVPFKVLVLRYAPEHICGDQQYHNPGNPAAKAAGCMGELNVTAWILRIVVLDCRL